MEEQGNRWRWRTGVGAGERMEEQDVGSPGRRDYKGGCTSEFCLLPPYLFPTLQHSMLASRRWSRSCLEPRTWTGQPGR